MINFARLSTTVLLLFFTSCERSVYIIDDFSRGDNNQQQSRHIDINKKLSWNIDGFYVGNSHEISPDYFNLEEDFFYLVALERLLSNQAGGNGSWRDTAKISRRYPVYVPGIPGPSYWEYKVTDRGRDAGYILVNLDNTDIIIPEMSVTGPTLNEEYVEALGAESDLKVFRYGPFLSAAKEKGNLFDEEFVGFYGLAPVGRVTLVNDEGLSDELLSEFYEIDERTRQAAIMKRNIPLYSNNMLNSIFRDLSLPTIDQLHERINSLKNSTSGLSRDDLGPFYLKNTFKVGGWHMPQWKQFNREEGKVGCAAVAWAMVLAYWHQFKNRTLLFGRVDLDRSEYGAESFLDTFIADIIWELADDYLNTIITDPWGMTLPVSMHHGMEYVEDVGYSVNSSHYETIRNGPQEQWEEVAAAIKDDRPSIILINSEENGSQIGTHYVAVEGTQRSYFFDMLGYYVNWGNGHKIKWIFDQSESGPNQHHIMDAFLIHDIPTNYPLHYTLLSFDVFDGVDGPLNSGDSPYLVIEGIRVPNEKVLTANTDNIQIEVELNRTINAEGSGRLNIVGGEFPIRIYPEPVN